MKKGVVILGSTGSVGTQALDVIGKLRDQFEVVGLAARASVSLLEKQAREWRPSLIAVEMESRAQELQRRLNGLGIKVLAGKRGVIEVAAAEKAHVVLVAIPGAAALLPVMEAAKAGKRIALASKEPMVIAGSLVLAEARSSGGEVVPVDSEPVAISQCMRSGKREEVRRFILTASGGPFYRSDAASLAWVTAEEALAHPVWQMGKKVTVDSATLMNKGLEVIESHMFFDIPVSQIEVLIHPQSIVHSLVEFVDGTVTAVLARPDMRLSIQYALTAPERLPSYLEGLDLTEIGRLEFEMPDTERFPCLSRAYEAARAGGTMPAVLSAADEVAVAAFLERRIGFLDIPGVLARVMERHEPRSPVTLDAVLEADAWARERAGVVVEKMAGRSQ